MPTRAEEQARRAKVQAQQDARRVELDIMAQMQAAADAERNEREKENNDFMLRVEAYRDAQARGVELPPVQIPTIQGIYQAAADADAKAVQEAEAARIAAITPAQLWRSTLPFAEQQRITKWEELNHQPWPFVGSQLAINAVEA